jgi:hypothetical protein
MVAVLPQEVDQGQAYLTKLGVKVDEARQSPISAAGVRGTPSLIIVDNIGVVRGVWIGKLSPDKEAEVLSWL